MGVPLVEKGSEYIIFAKKEPVDENKELYGALGIDQGQLKIENNVVTQYTPKTDSPMKKWEKISSFQKLRKK